MSRQGSTATAELTAAASRTHTWNVATSLTPVGYYTRAGFLPGVTEVRDQTGNWDKPGQTRQLMLSDGGWVIERTTNVEPYGFFAYNLADFQKIFKRLVDHGRAEWTFTEVAAGTTIHWSYTFFPLNRAAKPVLALIVKFLWGPYMKKVLPRIVAEVERQAGVTEATAHPIKWTTC